DRIVDRVLRMPDAAPRPALTPAGPVLRRKCSCDGTCESCSSESSDEDHGAVPRKPASATLPAQLAAAPPIVQRCSCGSADCPSCASSDQIQKKARVGGFDDPLE